VARGASTEYGGEEMSVMGSKAVFLSYASQDAEAARRICETLRAAGVEVWFDQSELRGGSAGQQNGDAKIRKQIKECVLPFGRMPVTSANRQARAGIGADLRNLLFPNGPKVGTAVAVGDRKNPNGVVAHGRR
jgi:hypothetical protein